MASLLESKPGTPLIELFSNENSDFSCSNGYCLSWTSLKSGLSGRKTIGESVRSVGMACLPGRSATWFLYDLRSLTPFEPSGLTLASDCAMGRRPYSRMTSVSKDGRTGSYFVSWSIK
ncbi:hypothetical protein KL938_003907 [Ogataea parapolymorpha]|nr:hypothetical protein KL938_003907 [Ogataea parapolymorpha]